MVSFTSTATICGSIFLVWRRSRTVPPTISSAFPLILTCMKTPNMAHRLNNFNTLSNGLLRCQGNGAAGTRLDFVRDPPPLCRLLETRSHVEPQLHVQVDRGHSAQGIGKRVVSRYRSRYGQHRTPVREVFIGVDSRRWGWRHTIGLYEYVCPHGHVGFSEAGRVSATSSRPLAPDQTAAHARPKAVFAAVARR